MRLVDNQKLSEYPQLYPLILYYMQKNYQKEMPNVFTEKPLIILRRWFSCKFKPFSKQILIKLKYWSRFPLKLLSYQIF